MSRLQMRTEVSLLQEAIHVSFIWTSRTPPVWPVRIVFTVQFDTSQMNSSPAEEPVTASWPLTKLSRVRPSVILSRVLQTHSYWIASTLALWAFTVLTRSPLRASQILRLIQLVVVIEMKEAHLIVWSRFMSKDYD